MLLGEQVSLVWGNPLLPLQRDLRHFLEPPVDLLLFPENWGQNIIIIIIFFFATLCDFQDLEGLGTGGEGDDRG